MTTETLNAIEGVTCNEVMGAMYAFPRIHLPETFVNKAKVCTEINHLSYNLSFHCIYSLLTFILGHIKYIFK